MEVLYSFNPSAQYQYYYWIIRYFYLATYENSLKIYISGTYNLSIVRIRQN